MAQTIARDLPYSTPQETGRYGLKLPFANYPAPNTRVRLIARNYRVTHAGYSPAITNLTSYANALLWSDDCTQASWTQSNVTATANATTDPEGNTNASFLNETVTNGQHFAYQTPSLSLGPVEFGCLLKSAGRQYGSLQVDDAGSHNVCSATFDLIGGVATTSVGAATIKSLGSGWYWCCVNGLVLTQGVAVGVLVGCSNSTAILPSYAGTVGVGIYVGCATVNGGSLATFPPIHTTSASRTIQTPDIDGLVSSAAEDNDLFAYQCLEGDPQAMASGLLAFTKTYCRIPPEFVSPSSYLFTTPNYLGAAQAGLAGVYTPQATLVGYYGVIANVLTGNSALINGYYDLAFPISSVVSSTSLVTQFVCAGNNFAAGDVLLIYDSSVSPFIWSATVLSVAGSTVNVYSISENNGGIIASGVLFPTVGAYVRKLIKDVPDIGQTVGLQAQVIEDYYLPGVTPGVNVFTDIPAQNPFNIVDYFAAWAGSKTWFNVQADPLASWMGPILVRKYTQAILGTTPHGSSTITSSGNFTVPAGVKNLRRVIVVPGGGGGGTNAGGGGQAGAPSIFENIACTPGQVFACVIGPGGGSATAGTASSFGGMTSTPGLAGVNGTGSSGGKGGGTNGGTGAAGGGGGGMSDLTSGVNATSGAAGAGGPGYVAGGGGGASSTGVAALGGIGVFGNGAGGGANGIAGATAPANSGAGGGGGGAGSTGGTGGSGLIIITW